MAEQSFTKDLQFYKFCSYGFLKNLRFFEAFLVLFFLDNQLTFLQIGILFSIREITRNILEIPAGILADSLGRKKTMVTSFGLYVISFIVFYLGYDYPVFIVAMLFYSLGDAFRTGTHKAMIFDYLSIHGWQNKKVEYYGRTRSCSQLGSALSALIAAVIVVFSGDFRMVFLYSLIPYFLDGLLVSSYPKALDGPVRQLETGRIKYAFKSVWYDFTITFKNQKFLKSISNIAFHTGYYRALKDYLQPVLQNLALALPIFLAMENEKRTAIVVGVVYFLIYLMTSFASRNSGRFAARWQQLFKPMNITLLIGLSMGLISGILYANEILVGAVILYVGIYVIENLRKPIGISLAADLIKKNALASALSAESQLHSLVAALLAPIIGLLADVYGLGIAIAAVSVLLLVTFPIIRVKA